MAKAKTLKVIKEYTSRVKKLDQILGELTKGYCATECPKAPYGCCIGTHGDYYECDISLPEFLKMQKEEALKNGWDGNEEERTGPYHDLICKYHTDNGCPITSFKSPLCIGYLCGELKEYLINEDARSREFLHSLDIFSHEIKISGNKRKLGRLFRGMDIAISEGNKVVARKRARKKLEEVVK